MVHAENTSAREASSGPLASRSSCRRRTKAKTPLALSPNSATEIARKAKW